MTLASSKDSLGSYLRDRRARLDPAALGLTPGRRRTPGLRREEVAQRANISPTWYTWLEQGRGGAPSAAVLDRIATGLTLNEHERTHLFMLALGRPPAPRYRPILGITPRLQRVLDAMECSPAIVKTATWDVVAWNKAATVLLADYSKLPCHRRNILRVMFDRSRIRVGREDWSSVARFVVGAFRSDVARAGSGAQDEAVELIDELRLNSPEFDALWRENVIVDHGEGVKCIHHPEAGLLDLEFSSFVVEGRPELNMIIYNPASTAVAECVRALVLAGA